MKPGQRIAHAEISKYDEKESDDRKIRRTAAFPSARNARMQECRVRQPGDERTGFFRIKSPRPAPRFVRPDRACDQQHRKSGKSKARGFVHKAVERIEAREPFAKLFRFEA